MRKENRKTILTLILHPVKIGVTYKLSSNDPIEKFAAIPEGNSKSLHGGSLRCVGQWLQSASSD